jgi:glyoxylase-like metal-dependent hydrolase (beta-lactamase superfamily II)
VGSPKVATQTILDLGDVRLTYLPDGRHTAPARWIFPEISDEALAAADPDLDRDGRVLMSVGGILIQSEAGNLLVDLGNGPNPRQPQGLGAEDRRNEGGNLLRSLATLGLTPGDIDDVVITHLHLDHIGWIIDPEGPDDTPFRNAMFHLGEAEWDYWTQPDSLALGSGPTRDQIAVLRPRVRACSEGLIRGPVGALPTPGHTPGHLSLRVTASNGTVLVLGDALHCRFEMLGRAGRYHFDIDHDQAQRSRRLLLEQLKTPNTWYAGGHFASYVFGRIDASGEIVQTA